MPFGEWVEFWYENYSKPMLRPSSQRSYEDFIRLYIRPKLGSVPLNKLTMNDLQQFFNWMRKDGRTLHRESRGGGLSDNMVRNCHSLCRRALEKAVAERLIVKNPIEECKAPPIRRKEMHLLSREELQKLLIQARAEGYYEDQTFADVTELERDFGFRPEITLEEGLARYARWYRNYYIEKRAEQ